MLRYRVEKLVTWPGPRTHGSEQKASPFKSRLGPMPWGRILDELERELTMLHGEDVVMKLELNDRDIRNDGTMRADARPQGSGVILEFTAERIEGKPRLTYPCDTFTSWQANVRAIAAILEALRKVERYGGVKSRQYQGFKALPAKTATSMTVEKAAEILADPRGAPRRAVPMMTIGEQLVSRRKERNLTQARVAWLAGITASHLSLIENGKRDPSLQVLNRLAVAVGARVLVVWEAI